MSESNFEQKLIHAYDTMLKRVHEFFDMPEAQTAPTLEQRIQLAKERAIELQELSAEEAEKVADYIKRDLQAAADYMHHSGETLSNWLDFDLQLIEARLLETFAFIADKTRLELQQLAYQARLAQDLYHTGEVTGIGKLVCENCGTVLTFTHTSRIPPCGSCHHTVFLRPDHPQLAK